MLLTKWFLDRQKDIAEKLTRESGELINVGESFPLQMKNVKLLVPKELEVYRVTKTMLDHRGTEFFYVTRQADDSTAYLSIVEAVKEKGEKEFKLNFAQNTASLLECPWYDGNTSRLIFDRLERTTGFSVFKKCERQSGPHPYKPMSG